MEVKESHTAIKTAKVIKNQLELYKLNHIKYFYSTSDAGSNMKLAFESILNFNHLTCYAHTIHNFLLKINDFEDLQMFFQRCRKLVKYFRKSSKN